MESLDTLLDQKIEIEKLDESHIGQTVTIAGWIHTMRWQKKFIFGKIADSAKSRLIPFQVLFETTKEPVANYDKPVLDYYKPLLTVCRGASIVIKGLIVKSPKSEQPIEMQAQQYYIIGDIYDPEHYPLAGTASENLEYLRTLPHLECQTQVKAAIYDIRQALEKAVTMFFDLHMFRKMDLPVITFSECEGGCQPMQATLLLTNNKRTKVPVKLTPTGESTDDVDFTKDFFGSKASLTVSAQLDLETRIFLGDVWTMTRAFRGEPSQTSRHLCEFSMIEFEMRLITKVEKLIGMSEGLIKYCIEYILTNYQQQLRFLESFTKSNVCEKLHTYLSTPFVQIRHAEAVTMMLEDSAVKLVEFNELPSYSSDLGSEHERYLTDTKYKIPVVVTRYPKAVKAFYMPVVQETPEESHGVEHVDCFDILVPGVGELVGGSMRIWKTDELVERINELALDTKPLEDYINLRRYGSVPHGGMGMGFERLVSFVTGIGNVKDCVAYPRYMNCSK